MIKTEKPKSLIVCINRRNSPGRHSCAGRGSEEIVAALERGIAERNIDIAIEPIHCLGRCADGPAMRLAPGGAFILETTLEDVPDILDRLKAICGHLVR